MGTDPGMDRDARAPFIVREVAESDFLLIRLLEERGHRLEAVNQLGSGGGPG